jgi:pyrroline-5-carboxylate reductase
MKKIGFIGFGHMGKALVRALLNGGIAPESLVISSRRIERVREFGNEFPGIGIVERSADVARNADVLFICVNTLEVINVVNDIGPHIRADTHIVSIAGGVTILSIENIIPGKISRVIPTLTCEVAKGTSLVCHNAMVDAGERQYLEDMLRKIGRVLVIGEEQFVVYTALSSCAPGLIAALFDVLIESATRCGNTDPGKAFQVLLSSLEGTAALLREKNESFSELVNRVARKGGNTEIGVALFKNRFPAVFDEMFTGMITNEKTRNARTAGQSS